MSAIWERISIEVRKILIRLLIIKPRMSDVWDRLMTNRK